MPTAVTWLLDVVPPDYRLHGVLRRHPLALAVLARHHLAACVQGAREGYRTARTELASLPPGGVDAVLEVYRAEGRRLVETARAVDLVGRALRGEVFTPQLGTRRALQEEGAPRGRAPRPRTPRRRVHHRRTPRPRRARRTRGAARGGAALHRAGRAEPGSLQHRRGPVGQILQARGVTLTEPARLRGGGGQHAGHPALHDERHRHQGERARGQGPGGAGRERRARPGRTGARPALGAAARTRDSSSPSACRT